MENLKYFNEKKYSKFMSFEDSDFNKQLNIMVKGKILIFAKKLNSLGNTFPNEVEKFKFQLEKHNILSTNYMFV